MVPTLHSPVGRGGLWLTIAVSLAAVVVVARVRGEATDRVQWWDDLPAARRAAVAGGRRALLLDLTADWCPACQELRRTTWSDPAVAAALAERCVPVRVDVDAHPDVARQYRADYLPTLVLTDADGRELRRSVGYLSPGEFLKWLDGGA